MLKEIEEVEAFVMNEDSVEESDSEDKGCPDYVGNILPRFSAAIIGTAGCLLTGHSIITAGISAGLCFFAGPPAVDFCLCAVENRALPAHTSKAFPLG